MRQGQRSPAQSRGSARTGCGEPAATPPPSAWPRIHGCAPLPHGRQLPARLSISLPRESWLDMAPLLELLAWLSLLAALDAAPALPPPPLPASRLELTRAWPTRAGGRPRPRAPYYMDDLRQLPRSPVWSARAAPCCPASAEQRAAASLASSGCRAALMGKRARRSLTPLATRAAIFPCACCELPASPGSDPDKGSASWIQLDHAARP